MITLTADLRTNVPLMDGQHKELFDFINAVETSKDVNEDVAKAIDFLSAYVIKHFNEEEALMREKNYPEYEWHRNWHQGYVNAVYNLKEEFVKNGPSEAFSEMLNKSIMNWIQRHIQNVDMKFARFVNSK